LLLALAAALIAGLSPASAATAAPAGGSALIVFLPPGAPAGAALGGLARSGSPDDRVLSDFAALPSFSIGLLSSTQGSYTTEQALLDITQGTRTSRSVYSPHDPPRLDLRADAAGGGTIVDWQAVLRRAAGVPQSIEPGLLAATVPGGGAYAGVDGVSHTDAVAVADTSGHVAAVSLGPAATLLGRVQALQASRRLVVADLPAGSAGFADLQALAGRRAPGAVLIALQRAPDASGHELLWAAIAGLGVHRELTSKTTNLPGFVAGIDLAPTVLKQLWVPIPDAMLGRPISASGALDVAALNKFRKRLTVITGRRFPAFEGLVLVWLMLVLAAGAIGGPARTRAALRLGGLALLWSPVAVLLGALLEPSRFAEQVLLIGTCFVLAALTDRLLPWPRGPLLPAVCGFAAIAADAAAGTHLLVRSLLGPNPSLGARFYGIGNELKSGLTVLVLVGVAAALFPALRSRRSAAIMAGAGVVLGVVIGSARLGAGVGGVILVAGGTAMATVLLLPGALTRRRVTAIAVSPIAALIALAVVDLATAGGRGHYTHDVIQVHTATNLHDIIVRRYGLAWEQLRRKDLGLATVLCLLAVAYALRNRQLFAALPDPAWRAALFGGLTAGVVGALSEDSGPLLFVVAVITLGAVSAYIRGAPVQA
jgi:hypothetical protein